MAADEKTSVEQSEQEQRERLQHCIKVWKTRKSPTTVRSYFEVLKSFVNYFNKPSFEDAMLWFCSLRRAEAWEKAIAWQRWSKKRAAVASVNLRTSALRSFIQAANEHGIIEWTLPLDFEPKQNARPMHRPSASEVDRILETAESQKDKGKAARDVAILWLMFEEGLRRNEIATLDYEHYDGKKLSVLRKRRRWRETIRIV